MTDEDRAISLIQSINREIASVLSSIKSKSDDTDTMDSAASTKLEEILAQLKQVRNHTNTFIDRYSKQTSLNNYWHYQKILFILIRTLTTNELQRGKTLIFKRLSLNHMILYWEYKRYQKNENASAAQITRNFLRKPFYYTQ